MIVDRKSEEDTIKKLITEMNQKQVQLNQLMQQIDKLNQELWYLRGKVDRTNELLKNIPGKSMEAVRKGEKDEERR